MNLTASDVERAIKRALAEDRLVRGLERTRAAARLGKAELLVVSSNCKARDDIVYLGKLSNIPVFVYPGDNMELGELCRKPYSVSALAIKGD
jgi:large subunit ribosomal protein L30e